MHTWLPALIERVNNAYPGLELEIEVDISPNLRDRLIAKDLNLALLLGPLASPDVLEPPVMHLSARLRGAATRSSCPTR